MKKEMWLAEYLERLEEAPDYRGDEWKIRHKIGDIIAISLMATLANCNRMKEIHLWAEYSEDTLRRYLELPNGIPSYDTMRRVMGSISPNFFNRMLQEWNELVEQKMPNKIRKILAIDGKTQCGNGNTNQKANHIVSAVDENKLCWGQELVQEKSNEITAIPKLLERLNIENQIITMDAMGTQKKIAEQIVGQKGDYCLALKGNMHNFYDDVKLFLDDEKFCKNFNYTCKKEKVRGGIEKREYWLTDDVSWLAQKDEWAGLKTLGMTKNTIVKNGGKTVEMRYFISSLELDVELFARAVRAHWQVESYHWWLDTTLREDESTILDKQCALNLNILRKLVLAILKASDIGNKYTSLQGKRVCISANPIRFLETVFAT
jgi:predicted transposase YbfD/YdcC